MYVYIIFSIVITLEYKYKIFGIRNWIVCLWKRANLKCIEKRLLLSPKLEAVMGKEEPAL